LCFLSNGRRRGWNSGAYFLFLPVPLSAPKAHVNSIKVRLPLPPVPSSRLGSTRDVSRFGSHQMSQPGLVEKYFNYAVGGNPFSISPATLVETFLQKGFLRHALAHSRPPPWGSRRAQIYRPVSPSWTFVPMIKSEAGLPIQHCAPEWSPNFSRDEAFQSQPNFCYHLFRPSALSPCHTRLLFDFPLLSPRQTLDREILFPLILISLLLLPPRTCFFHPV